MVRRQQLQRVAPEAVCAAVADMGDVDFAGTEQQRCQRRLHLARPLTGNCGVEDALVRGTVRIPEHRRGPDVRLIGLAGLVEQLGQGQAAGDIAATVPSEAIGDGEQETSSRPFVPDAADRTPPLPIRDRVGDELRPAAEEGSAGARGEATPAEVVLISLANRTGRRQGGVLDQQGPRPCLDELGGPLLDRQRRFGSTRWIRSQEAGRRCGEIRPAIRIAPRPRSEL
jgi:hypothetical protein